MSAAATVVYEQDGRRHAIEVETIPRSQRRNRTAGEVVKTSVAPVRRAPLHL
jgi:hypothetical protein